MPPTQLQQLKELQRQRSERTPFKTHNEFLIWSDSVAPLISFDMSLKRAFQNHVSTANMLNNMQGVDYPTQAVNEAIGILNQAITLLEQKYNSTAEVMPKPNSATNQTTNRANDKQRWQNNPVGTIGIGVIIVIIGAMAIYLIKTHFGIPL